MTDNTKLNVMDYILGGTDLVIGTLLSTFRLSFLFSWHAREGTIHEICKSYHFIFAH
jgi:hypothetical protein